LARKQKALETARQKLEGTRGQVEKLLAEAKEAETLMAGLEVEIEALAKEISLGPKLDSKPSCEGTVQGADQVPAHCKEGEAWKKAQANYDEALKTMQDLVQALKPEVVEEVAAPATPTSSQQSSQARAEVDLMDASEDADMEEWDDDSKAVLDKVFADAALGALSDELRKELKRKANEAVDGALKARKHLLKTRKARSTLG
jgi:hypothetical protein